MYLALRWNLLPVCVKSMQESQFAARVLAASFVSLLNMLVRTHGNFQAGFVVLCTCKFREEFIVGKHGGVGRFVVMPRLHPPRLDELRCQVCDLIGNTSTPALAA